MSKMAYIGIGSNMGSPLANCRQAIARLGDHSKITLLACSSFYETEPVGRTHQSWFVNAAVKIITDLEPDSLLESLLDIEKAMGRIRNEKWGSRIIDLDLLLYEERIIKTPRLEIPHPEMNKRRFVLAPLSELAPDLVHPMAKKPIQQLLSELPEDKKVVRVQTST